MRSPDLRALAVDTEPCTIRRLLGAAWSIPTFIVPALLVTHVMIFARLLRARSRATQP